MNYQEADAKLQGRCAQRRKLCNNTYLERRSDGIAVRLHDTDVVTFYEDGRIGVNTGGWNTVTTKDRIRAYSPVSVWTEIGHAFAGYNGQTVALVRGRRADVLADGTLVGESAEQERQLIRDERNEAARAGNRARYWMRKARGIYTDTSNCAARRDRRRWNCGTFGRWNRLTVGQYPCGCRVYHKAPNARNLTVEKILAEDNASVRVAMMNVYGIERFFLDAKANVLDEQAGYQLLSLRLSNWADIRALKMTCPSTGAVYVNTVPPNDGTVSQALDWMFNTTDYLGTVSQQA